EKLAEFDTGYRVAVNSTMKTTQRAATVVFMAKDPAGHKGMYVSRLHFEGRDPDSPTAITVDKPKLIVEMGQSIAGLSGTVTDVSYWIPINNRNAGDLVFWVKTSTEQRAILRSRAPDRRPVLFI